MEANEFIGLHEYYQGLPQADRTMMLLYYVDELLPREIASVLDLNIEEVVMKLTDLRKNAGNSLMSHNHMKLVAYA